MRGEPETIAEGLQRRTGEVWGSSARVEVCHNTCAQSLNSWLLRVTLYSPLRTKYKDSEPHSLLLTNWVAKWRGIERDRGKETKGETEIAREGERRIRESEWVWWSDGFPRWASNIFFSSNYSLAWMIQIDCTVHELSIAEASYVFLQYVNIRICMCVWI